MRAATLLVHCSSVALLSQLERLDFVLFWLLSGERLLLGLQRVALILCFGSTITVWLFVCSMLVGRFAVAG